MAMGSTGTINMTAKMISDIKAAVEDYRGKADALATNLASEISGLIPANFSGAAAEGFRSYYDSNIAEQLIGQSLKQLLDSIDQIADSISDAIPGAPGVDDQLGEGNRQ